MWNVNCIPYCHTPKRVSYYQDNRTRFRNFSSLSVATCYEPQYAAQTIVTYNQTIVTYTQKHVSVCIEQRHWLILTISAAGTDLSNTRHRGVQLPKLFYSDSVISVSSFTTRLSLFLFALFQ